MVEKKIRVLSGGERARLVLAGLLLQRHNVLVLDEPGNHLDVESVESLAEALIGYPGTVVFTSHDRHFMHRVATHVVEVRAGRVASYPGDYDEYVYRVQSEIDTGLRAPHASGAPVSLPASAAPDRKASARADRDAQKKLKAVERTQLATVTSELAALEEEWLQLSAEMESA
jgi:ATP-binding cassette subfamily F protein 3